MLRCLVLLLLSPLTVALQPRDFRVPPVDFTQLSSSPNNAHNFKLLSHLQDNGIIALQNVPNFATLRQEYLRTAATCAVQAQKKGAEFLLHRQLRDGTNRYTVSLESGRQLTETLDQSAELLAICPEYVEIHAAFSAAVELAVANVGTALDATQKFKVVAEQGAVAMTARKLLEESVHLDHFHAYEAAEDLRRLEEDVEINVADMSLELHTDNGLMIAMSAPEYFEVSSSGELQHKDTQAGDAGLFIQTAKGEIVRPVLQQDELILMLGSGIDDWIKTSPPLHSVLHGMRYPRTVSVVEDGQDNKLLRSWFGKMILLESNQVMDNTGLTFGQYTNQTTRYLVQQEAEDHQTFGAVACPPQRHLAASDNSCSLKLCSLKSTASASDLKTSCQITCNHDAASDRALCEQYCDCEDSTSSATTCWMLCVENFSSDVCPGEQECNNASTQDKLAMTCVGGTTAPSTSTSSTTGSSNGSSTTTAPSTTTPSSTTPSTTTAPTATTPSTTTPSSATGSAASSTNVGDESTTASSSGGTSSTATASSTADAVSSASTSASASSSTSASSSAASVVPLAMFVNGVAVLVAAFLCIQ
ncbi:hypothetical protein V7S43_001927 [Phytophthora oleae]|uniref:Uncharacterized protein n=1 Tax=Phytophthora oleae TaxID=2107226 RepID=A0ABD3G0E7_9STRA